MGQIFHKKKLNTLFFQKKTIQFTVNVLFLCIDNQLFINKKLDCKWL